MSISWTGHKLEQLRRAIAELEESVYARECAPGDIILDTIGNLDNALSSPSSTCIRSAGSIVQPILAMAAVSEPVTECHTERLRSCSEEPNQDSESFIHVHTKTKESNSSIESTTVVLNAEAVSLPFQPQSPNSCGPHF